MFITKKRFRQTHQKVHNAFSHVKKETENLNAWIAHLHQRNIEQQQFIHTIHQKLDHHESQIDTALTHAVDTKNIWQRLEHMNEKVTTLHDHHTARQEVQQLTNQLTPKKNLKEKVLQTFQRKSKHYLKSTILQYITQHQKISALQLKDIIVDQQGLTSKSSFYRILAEVEKEDHITVINDGKYKIFLAQGILNQ